MAPTSQTLIAQGEARLKKRIGILGLFAMCVGLNIGGALFALSTTAAGLTGPSLPLAMLVSSVPALLAVVPYGVLASALPTTSATYRYSQLVSPLLALVSMLSLLFCILIGGQPLYALAFGKYLHSLIPLDPILAGAAVLTMFFVVNLLGIRLASRIQVLLFIVLLAALLLFVALGLPRVEAARFADPFPNGAGGVLAAAGLLFTFCAGGFFVVDLGGEVAEAKRVFPRVLFFGLAFVVFLYVLIHCVIAGVTNAASLKDESLIEVAEGFMSGATLTFFVVGGALVACATTINIIFSVVSRGLMVVANEGLLPSFLGRVNKKFGTPHWGLAAAYLVCIASLICNPSLMFFGSMLNLGLVFAITVVVLAGYLLPDRYPALFERSSVRVSRRSLRAVCIAVIGLNLTIFAFFFWVIQWSALLFFVIVLFCAIYALTCKKALSLIRSRLRKQWAVPFDSAGPELEGTP